MILDISSSTHLKSLFLLPSENTYIFLSPPITFSHSYSFLFHLFNTTRAILHIIIYYPIHISSTHSSQLNIISVFFEKLDNFNSLPSTITYNHTPIKFPTMHDLLQLLISLQLIKISIHTIHHLSNPTKYSYPKHPHSIPSPQTKQSSSSSSSQSTLT